MKFLEIPLVIVIIGICACGLMFIIHKSGAMHYHYNPDYTCTVTVDQSEKIEQAISNSIEEVKSRNFKIIGLEVRCVSDGKKEIICTGITKANLIKDD